MAYKIKTSLWQTGGIGMPVKSGLFDFLSKGQEQLFELLATMSGFDTSSCNPVFIFQVANESSPGENGYAFYQGEFFYFVNCNSFPSNPKVYLVEEPYTTFADPTQMSDTSQKYVHIIRSLAVYDSTAVPSPVAGGSITILPSPYDEVGNIQKSAALNDWVVPPLAAGWSNVGGTIDTVGYIKQPTLMNKYPNIVRLKGAIQNSGAVAGGGVTLFTLPAGFIPAKAMYFPVSIYNIAGTSWGIATLLVDTSGHVAIEVNTGQITAGMFVNMNGIEFNV